MGSSMRSLRINLGADDSFTAVAAYMCSHDGAVPAFPGFIRARSGG